MKIDIGAVGTSGTGGNGSGSNRHFCSADVKIRACPKSPREQLCVQQPIILCKKEKKDVERDV